MDTDLQDTPATLMMSMDTDDSGENDTFYDHILLRVCS